jgi:hypothetical protein
VFKKKPDSKGGDSGSGSGTGARTDAPNGTKKVDAKVDVKVDAKVDVPVVDPKKNAGMFNMFGDNAGKKEPEPVKPQVPPPPAKEANINALFGTGPAAKV